MNTTEWKHRTSTDYRRGFVEGQSGERDIYLLQSGSTNQEEYEQGFRDGLCSVLLSEITILNESLYSDNRVQIKYSRWDPLQLIRSSISSLVYTQGISLQYLV